ncbi:MAG: hypothetical protein OXN92_12755 [Gammaproteobacteria bacterium]|nr:hypothetical protein [Gammaproteobacteria bacterium]
MLAELCLLAQGAAGEAWRRRRKKNNVVPVGRARRWRVSEMGNPVYCAHG